MPLQATSGAASYDAFGGGVPVVPAYIEEVFSTYLYQADGSSTQTINNGIDLSGKGGLVWIKSRSNATGNVLVDTVRGSPNVIQSNTTNAQASWTNEFGSFSSTGFTVPYNTIYGETNFQTRTYTSWTFRKQPKFFDVVTYSGDGNTFQTINHNLGSTPGCIIVKQTNSGSTNWVVYHRSIGTDTLRLNLTNAKTGLGGAMLPSSTSVDFYGSGGSDPLNASGGTYVAYLFAHNAGGFGLTGTDNVISCGSYTTNASAVGSATLGYEPQFLMVKRATGVGEWYIVDNMRGWGMTQAPTLRPNSSGIEDATGFGGSLIPTATGFEDNGAIATSSTLIYIAIRRGPMKVPTSGTSVFLPQTRTGTDSGTVTVSNIGFTPDLAIIQARGSNQGVFEDRLRGNFALFSPQTNAESNTGVEGASGQQGWAFNASTGYGNGNDNYINYFLKRAPGYFDEVCYSGNSAQTAYNHNLGVAPELVIVKVRNVSGESWPVWCIYGTQQNSWATILDGTNPYQNRGANLWGTNPVAAPSMTSTTFRLGNNDAVNVSGNTYVAYLFATAAGVSKVGSYTGNGSTQTINCGFTGGARLVLIKRTDSTGDWYVYDTARGMTVLTDPYLLLNQTVAETATLGSVTTVSTGFAVNASILAAINTNAASYIFLALA